MSSVISPDRRQLTLELEPGLTQRYRCVRDAVAPGNLSVALSDDGVRHLSVDALERYVQTSGDLTPIYYLVERYLGDQGAARAEALDRVLRVAEQLEALPAMLAAAGLHAKKARR